MTSASDALDHLLIGARTLESGIDWLEMKTGVRAVMGGSHPGLGTWNALASLGPAKYVEIIAPDPTQPGVPTFYVPRLRDFIVPKIATWAARGTGLASGFRDRLPETFQCSPPQPGSRVRADGVRLAWTLAFPKHREHGNFGGTLPFLLEWENMDVHPSLAAPSGLSVLSMSLSHPLAEDLQAALRVLGIETAVGRSDGPSVTVELDTPKGRVAL